MHLAAAAAAQLLAAPSASAEGTSPSRKRDLSPMRELVHLLTRERWDLRRNFLLILALMLGYNLSGTLILCLW